MSTIPLALSVIQKILIIWIFDTPEEKLVPDRHRSHKHSKRSDETVKSIINYILNHFTSPLATTEVTNTQRDQRRLLNL